MTWVTEQVRLARQMARRWAVGPLAVRGALFVAGIVTLALATPSTLLLGRGIPVILAGAALVAVAPRGRFVTGLLLLAMVGWLASTIFFDDRVTAVRLVSLAAAMYLLHTLAALAAVLPYDAVLPPGVVGGWLLRALVVVAVSAAVGIFALVEAPQLESVGYLVASIVGVGVVGALVWVLTRAVQR